MQNRPVGMPGLRKDGLETLPPAQWMDLGRVSLRYVLNGPGADDGAPAVVLVHEMGGSLETWDQTFMRLAQRHQVLAYDWRGAGHSEKIRGQVTLDDHTGDLAALLDALGFVKPVVLAGCAVGAAISAAFAARNPKRVAGLVLFSPAMGILPENRDQSETVIQTFEQGGMRTSAETSLSRGYPEQFRVGREARFDEFRARWIANDPSSFAATYRMLLEMEAKPILGAICCPTLAVGGDFDAVRTADYVRTIASSIPGASFLTVPGGHHMPHQIPLKVAQLIEEFMDEIS